MFLCELRMAVAFSLLFFSMMISIRIVRSSRVWSETNRKELDNKILVVKHSVTLPPATPVPPSNCRRSQWNYTTVTV